MNHIEITVEEHAAYVAAVAERDTLRAKLAEVDDVVAKLRTEFPDLSRESLAGMLRALSSGWAFAWSAKATRERLIKCQVRIYDLERERDMRRKQIAEEEASHAETLQMFHRARDTRDTLRKQLADLNHKYAALLNESAKEDAAKANAPLRIVLDQGPPTESGYYLRTGCLTSMYGYDGLHLSFVDGNDIGKAWHADVRWSRRLDIVVPESEVGG